MRRFTSPTTALDSTWGEGGREDEAMGGGQRWTAKGG